MGSAQRRIKKLLLLDKEKKQNAQKMNSTSEDSSLKPRPFSVTRDFLNITEGVSLTAEFLNRQASPRNLNRPEYALL